MNKNNEYEYIIIGAGLCGLVLAKELSNKGKKLLVLERGGVIKHLGSSVLSPLYYDQCALAKSNQGVYIYRAFGIGGTTLFCCNNAIKPSSRITDSIGIDIHKELEEVEIECRPNVDHFPIGKASKKIMEAANELGHDMKIMPKFAAIGKCVSCGNCVLGCKHGAKWSVLEIFKNAKSENIDIVTNFKAKKILQENGNSIGVEGRYGKFQKRKYYAEKTILSAGGIGTPVILQNSGLDAGEKLFVDLFNISYGICESLNHTKELMMACVCDKYYDSDDFILSVCVEPVISFPTCVSKKDMISVFSFDKMIGIMTKIADDNIGKVYRNGKIDKMPTQRDLEKLKRGSDIAKEILLECDVRKESIIVTKPRGGHPGGTAAIGDVIDNKLGTKMKNLFVCDASIFPKAPGIPLIYILIALAKWLAGNI